MWSEAKKKIIACAIQENKGQKAEQNLDQNKIKKEILKQKRKLDDRSLEIRKAALKEMDESKNKLRNLDRNTLCKIREISAARYKLQGEKSTKWWFNLNKDKGSQDTILGLYGTGGNLKTSTREMNNIGTEYHRNLN